ncbi:DNA-binding transcriptional LysR family regulator [Actinomycetospora succinea]|uniref:DNA-binding transcriptional LysR family regulator n=1 Tax=Actinomycetospora succinea TaxID=663603 RepID=A0A4R6VP68_9PSEU|nr:LysR family transcriptional regulator [Actinomycetospora succinea]TDQ61205.1 DNA-binding transcriptional LysR family regulator [Actinomycetospora succinea]
MDIRELRYVVTLAEERHFRKAAERHYIAPQAFGRHVRALEKEIGARLFDRTSRRVDVTPAGARLVERAREVLARVDDLAAAVRDAPPAPDDTVVRVGVLGFGAADRWPDLRELVRAQLPGRTLVHIELDWDTQYEAVRDGEVDVAVIHDVGPVEGVRLNRLFTTPRVAVVPAASPLADADRLAEDDVDGHAWVAVNGRHPGLGAWAGVTGQASRRSPVVRTPAAIPAAVATSGMLGVHGELARRFFPRPDVCFVPLAGEDAQVSVATRVDDDSRTATAFRQAADLLAT